jgi:hypothetical protein
MSFKRKQKLAVDWWSGSSGKERLPSKHWALSSSTVTAKTVTKPCCDFDRNCVKLTGPNSRT